MQTYDFLMIFVLVGLTLYGYAKGMAWQLAYLTSFIASYFVAVKFSGQLAPVFGDAAPWNKFAAMVAIYAATSLAIWVVFRYVRRGIDKVKLQSFDRQMGAIVGAARGVLWCTAITFVVMTVLPDTFAGIKRQVILSKSGFYIAKLIDKADAVMPPEVHEVVGPRLDELEYELNQDPGGPAPPFQQQPAPSPWGQANAPAGSWPNVAQPGAAPAQPGAWPNVPQPTGTPATPAAWPQPQPNNGGAWPQ